LRQQYEPAVIRYFLLTVHYRTPLEFSYERLDEAKSALERLRTAYQRATAFLRESGGAQPDPAVAEPYLQQFRDAMNHDFNTAQAIAAAFEVVREINTRLNAPEGAAQPETLAELAGLQDALQWMLETVLGIPLHMPDTAQSETLEHLMRCIIVWRQELRARKLYDLADRIRDDLKAIGIILEDTPQGTLWRMA
jgi:cysteinyl-tRNA synthetase